MLLLMATACGGAGIREGPLPTPTAPTSFRFEARSETPGATLSFTGAWVAPDRLYAEGETNRDRAGPQPFRVLSVASATWYDSDEGWTAGTNQLYHDVTAIVPVGKGFDPGTGVYPLLDERPFERERVGEFVTRRFTLDGRDRQVRRRAIRFEAEAGDRPGTGWCASPPPASRAPPGACGPACGQHLALG